MDAAELTLKVDVAWGYNTSQLVVLLKGSWSSCPALYDRISNPDMLLYFVYFVTIYIYIAWFFTWEFSCFKTVLWFCF